MSSTINADTTNGVVITSDTSGEIKLQSAGADIATVNSSGITLATSKDLTLSSTALDASASGIYLGGTASANLLDDYEEGTWTPVWNGTSGSMSYTKQSGAYTKVGSLVVATCHIITSANNSLTGTTSLSGLPFVSDTTINLYTACPMHVEQVNLATSAWIWGHVNTGLSTATIRYWVNNTAAGVLQGTALNNNSDIMITCSYKTSV